MVRVFLFVIHSLEEKTHFEIQSFSSQQINYSYLQEEKSMPARNLLLALTKKSIYDLTVILWSLASPIFNYIREKS